MISNFDYETYFGDGKENELHWLVSFSKIVGINEKIGEYKNAYLNIKLAKILEITTLIFLSMPI